MQYEQLIDAAMPTGGGAVPPEAMANGGMLPQEQNGAPAQATYLAPPAVHPSGVQVYQ